MKHRGFTVLEIIFALTIAVIIVGILVAFIMQSRAIYQAADISASLQANSRQAIERIALDLKRTNRTKIIITQNSPVAGTDMIQYQLPQYDTNSLPVSVGSAISWDAACSIVVNNITQQLLQTQNGNTRILASNVNSVQFFDHARDASLNLDELRVDLNMRGVATDGRVFSLGSTSRIKMRN